MCRAPSVNPFERPWLNVNLQRRGKECRVVQVNQTFEIFLWCYMDSQLFSSNGDTSSEATD